MVLSDHMAAFALVGARHRAAKPAQLYANEPPPAWIQPDQQGQAAGGGGGGNGKAGGDGAAATAVMVRPPVVVELAVGDRRGGVGAAASGEDTGKGEPEGQSRVMTCGCHR